MLSLTYALLSIASGATHLFAGVPDAIAPREEIVVAEQSGSSDGPTFIAGARAVSNWRGEAVEDLHPTPLSALAVVLGAERPVITRCVKLNNYWCIKSARWNGEIGADDEGHTGFASAEHGADAAVRLLRRYYLEFNRKSALDIVRRWAPAECRVATGSGPPAVLAVRGIGNTLRARWLTGGRAKPAPTRVASSGGAVALPRAAPPQKPARSRVSAVPLRPLPTFRMPSIMAGMGAPKPIAAAALPGRVPQRRQPTAASVAAAKAAAAQRTAARAAPSKVRVAALAATPKTTGSVPVTPAPPPPRPQAVASPPAASPPPAPRPAVACAPDEQRIQNYAGRMVQGLDLQPGDDLKLFDPDGRPQPNLARVLLAMSSVELGYLRATAELVEEAILRATPRPPLREDQGVAAPSGSVL